MALAIGEGAVRLAGPQLRSSFYQMDPDLGWVLRPGASGVQTDENPVPVQINQAGMRSGREFPLAKEPGVFRVAVLGDSFAESLQVREEETFALLLERQLAACVRLAKGERPKRVEVLNFGVQGYGTAQEWLVWRQKAKAYQPDAVLLLLYTGNDLYNNHPVLNPTNADAAPYLVVQGPGAGADSVRSGTEVVLQAPAASQGAGKELWVGLTRVSQLAALGNEVYYKWQRGQVSQEEAARREKFGDNYMDRLIYGPPRHAEMEEAWRTTEAALPAMAREVEASGAKFYLALASSGIQVHPRPEIRQAFVQAVGGSDILYAEKRLAGVAHLAGIRHVVLAEKMQSEAEATGVYFHGFGGESQGKGHWNVAGHRAVAAALLELFCGK